MTALLDAFKLIWNYHFCFIRRLSVNIHLRKLYDLLEVLVVNQWWIWLTLNGPGGLNQDAPCWEACHLPPDAPRSIRPQCKFVFWCLELLGEKKNWGCKKNFLKNSRFKIFFQKFSIEKKFFFPVFPKFFNKKKIFYVKFEFNIIWAFIWCTYCMCLKQK